MLKALLIRALRVLGEMFKETRGNPYYIVEESLVDLWIIAIWKTTWKWLTEIQLRFPSNG